MKRKSILLIGLGRFGKHIAKELSELGNEIMAVDRDEQRVNDIMSLVTNAQIGDSTNEQFLKSLGVENYDICIVTIGGDFQSSLETTCLLKELGGKLVVSRAERDGQAKFLLRNGADEIVYPQKQLASWMAIRYTYDNVFDYIKLDDDHAIFEVSVPKAWLGKTIGEIDIRKKYEINILATKEKGKINAKVTPQTMLGEQITLLVLGDKKDLKKCFNI
jgi:trk system potassium uptake protein TrkA